MLDLIIGTNHKPQESHELIEAVSALGLTEGSFYVGYPILAGPDERFTIDALLVSTKFGVVIFDLLDSAPAPDAAADFWRDRVEYEDQLARGLTAKLVIQRDLTRGRQLAFAPQVLAFGPHTVSPPDHVDGLIYANAASLAQVLGQFDPLPDVYLRSLNAAIERVSTIKPRNKRASVARLDSRGAILKNVEKQIANLDRWQKRGAIESPEGPQRIRGLAGSGKTVVLALKAAYLHAQHPEWTIIVTYQTRSLYEQFKDFIRRFCYESMNDEPDWMKIRILPGWGSPREPGVCSEIAALNKVPIRTFTSAKDHFGRARAFDGVCDELLAVQTVSQRMLCDAILIDEAQDFPPSFFQLVFQSLPSPKRIVWAYDELQSLNETTMPPLAKLFGVDEQGHARVDLTDHPDEPHKDIILPRCYRNPPWALTIAHGLGFGTCRPRGLVQAFDEPTLWRDIGYEIVSGSLEPTHVVELQRRPDASPVFFQQQLDPSDSFITKQFSTISEQTAWVAEQIVQNVRVDELEPGDIVVIYPDPITVPSNAAPLVAELGARGIRAHIAGVSTARDQFFSADSVTISGIYRAKGNEAAMVYLMNAEYCAQGPELLRRRNTLFTAITRSRAWVRVCGIGHAMTELQDEINEIIAKNYHLRFQVPTPGELASIRSIHRDRTEAERKKVENTRETMRAITEDLEKGLLSVDDLPLDVRQRLQSLFAVRS